MGRIRTDGKGEPERSKDGQMDREGSGEGERRGGEGSKEDWFREKRVRRIGLGRREKSSSLQMGR
jgi:hypothetical protein